MARRSWGRSIVLALLTAAGVAAAQLGIGYGLGVITWTARTDAARSADVWSSALVWTTWIGATSVVVGAIVGERLGGPASGGRFARVMWRITVALAATLGSLVILPLVGVPAREADVVDTYAPHLMAGIYASIGVVLGLVVSLLALPIRAVAANVLATAGWVWVLAIVVVSDAAVTGEPLAYGQLFVWKFTDLGPIWHGIYLPGALLMLGSAMLIGGLAAFPAAGRGANRLGVAISGAIGPAIVATAYLLTKVPSGAPQEQLSAHSIAPYVVAAGLVGSVLVAAVGGAPARRVRTAETVQVTLADIAPPPNPPQWGDPY